MRFFTNPSLFCADLIASAIWLAIPSTSRLTFKPTSAAVVQAVVVCDIFGAGFSSAEAKDKGAIVKAAPRASVIDTNTFQVVSSFVFIWLHYTHTLLNVFVISILLK